MLKFYVGLLSIFFTSTAFAWLCPNNFNTINAGDSLEKVQAVCGAPAMAKKSEEEPDVPQEWGYYVQVNPPNPNTIKMSVVFVNKKVVNITINAMSLVSTSVCGSTMNVGDTMDAVKSACGNPMFINKQPPRPGQNPTTIDELKYNGPAPNVLVFENGLLKERK